MNSPTCPAEAVSHKLLTGLTIEAPLVGFEFKTFIYSVNSATCPPPRCRNRLKCVSISSSEKSSIFCETKTVRFIIVVYKLTKLLEGSKENYVYLIYPELILKRCLRFLSTKKISTKIQAF